MHSKPDLAEIPDKVSLLKFSPVPLLLQCITLTQLNLNT